MLPRLYCGQNLSSGPSCPGRVKVSEKLGATVVKLVVPGHLKIGTWAEMGQNQIRVGWGIPPLQKNKKK